MGPLDGGGVMKAAVRSALLLFAATSAAASDRFEQLSCSEAESYFLERLDVPVLRGMTIGVWAPFAELDPFKKWQVVAESYRQEADVVWQELDRNGYLEHIAGSDVLVLSSEGNDPVTAYDDLLATDRLEVCMRAFLHQSDMAQNEAVTGFDAVYPQDFRASLREFMEEQL